VLRITKVIGAAELTSERLEEVLLSGSALLRSLNLGEGGLYRLRDTYRGSTRGEAAELFAHCTQG
jgi:hypothetical protein